MATRKVISQRIGLPPPRIFSLNSFVKYRLRAVFSTSLIAVRDTRESRMREKSHEGVKKTPLRTV
jgi:hypothetical protein